MKTVRAILDELLRLRVADEVQCRRLFKKLRRRTGPNPPPHTPHS